ncbi:MAG: DNA phosphorothioation-dependent restriction protein DptG [Clostridiaceae bacterium]
MRYEVNIEELSKNFKFKLENPSGKCNLIHKSGNKFKLLPYTTNDANIVMNFKGVVGAFSRLTSNKELSKNFEISNFVEDVVNKVGEFQGINSKVVFKDLVESMFIDNDELINFDIKTLNYISSLATDEKIAKFIYSILFDDELKDAVSNKIDSDVSNLLYKLVLQSLPELKDKKIEKEDFKCCLPFVKELFIEDFRFLINNEELYKESLRRLLEYYYFFYVSQLSLKLSKFEKADLSKADDIYFTLGWESTSKNRTAYKFGWDMLKNTTASLFSHAVTLELLNHCNSIKQLDYKEIYELFNSEEENELILGEVNSLINTYRGQIGDIDWNKFSSPDKTSDNKAFDKVYELFYTIDYQFKNSSRNRPYEAYKKWFTKFSEGNFLKKRGPLGYNLNITEEDIIFMTKICIKDREKLKLKSLFSEFEKRGFFFDRESKSKIIQLYEKLNLIEKKSDSGDAQYVKSIL